MKFCTENIIAYHFIEHVLLSFLLEEPQCYIEEHDLEHKENISISPQKYPTALDCSKQVSKGPLE